jgi:hypothetical protein
MFDEEEDIVEGRKEDGGGDDGQLESMLKWSAD